MEAGDGVTIDHLGWSGFRIELPGRGTVLLDPPAGAALPQSGPLFILLSHGHPEHVAGARNHLARPAGAETTIVASPVLCRYLARRAGCGGATFRPVGAGDRLALADGLALEVFRWRHFPLLPPGFGAKLRHIARLLSRPGLAARIVLAGLAGPRVETMLGFRLDLDGQEIVAYGEGLHRRCRAGEVAANCRGTPGSLLLLAVEPEDEQALPALVAAAGVDTAVLYEPHAVWREAFGMPRADLTGLKQALEAAGIRAAIVAPARSRTRPAAPHAGA